MSVRWCVAFQAVVDKQDRRHLPSGRRLLLRWGLRLATLSLVAFWWVPVAGGFALPVMVLIYYGAYRTAYKNLATSA